MNLERMMWIHDGDVVNLMGSDDADWSVDCRHSNFDVLVQHGVIREVHVDGGVLTAVNISVEHILRLCLEGKLAFRYLEVRTKPERTRAQLLERRKELSYELRSVELALGIREGMKS